MLVTLEFFVSYMPFFRSIFAISWKCFKMCLLASRWWPLSMAVRILGCRPVANATAAQERLIWLGERLFWKTKKRQVLFMSWCCVWFTALHPLCVGSNSKYELGMTLWTGNQVLKPIDCIVCIHVYSASCSAHQSEVTPPTRLGGAGTAVLQSNCVRRTCSRSLHSNCFGRGLNPYSLCYKLSDLTDRPSCQTLMALCNLYFSLQDLCYFRCSGSLYVFCSVERISRMCTVPSYYCNFWLECCVSKLQCLFNSLDSCWEIPAGRLRIAWLLHLTWSTSCRWKRIHWPSAENASLPLFWWKRNKKSESVTRSLFLVWEQVNISHMRIF